ncbi:hypothetical protein A359_00720 [secondary endosymbiont of Ctenarytaina eucalypti]|uniref:Uncharacterized protein n=1 Tax=secondary endosymbiont of Ctenarytaina eucalypti TaxID=1199245 RepID=J3TEX4_9ENTR|nr:hypothetical protein A359_00720 [secondary endosymbiont of Ctenarytaina eucalypti]
MKGSVSNYLHSSTLHEECYAESHLTTVLKIWAASVEAANDTHYSRH